MSPISRREFLKYAAAVLVTFGVTSAAWGAAYYAPKPPAKPPIKIGHQADKTGILAYWGYWLDKAGATAVKYINEELDGINGRPIEYIVEDTASDVTVGIAKLRKLVEVDNVDYALGAVHSTIGLRCAPLAKELKVVYSPKGHITGITERDPYGVGNRYVFRMMTNVKSEVTAMLNGMTTEGLIGDEIGTKWAVMYADYAFGHSYRDELSALAPPAGIEIVKTIGIPFPAPPDVSPYVLEVPPEADTIFYLSHFMFRNNLRYCFCRQFVNFIYFL